MSRVLAIIPAYNEQDNIVSTVEDLKRHAPEVDYVVVNDGSVDATARICREQGYHMLNLVTNLGLDGAFQTGAKYALDHGYDYILQFDADGQHSAAYVHAMMENAEQTGAAIVVGSRFLTNKKPHSLRMLGSSLITLIIRLTTRVKIEDPTSGMRLFASETLPYLAKGADYSPEPDTLALFILKGMKVTEVPVTMRNRLHGTSYFNLTKSVAYMLRVCISILFMQWFRKGAL